MNHKCIRQGLMVGMCMLAVGLCGCTESNQPDDPVDTADPGDTLGTLSKDAQLSSSTAKPDWRHIWSTLTLKTD